MLQKWKIHFGTGFPLPLLLQSFGVLAAVICVTLGQAINFHRSPKIHNLRSWFSSSEAFRSEFSDEIVYENKHCCDCSSALHCRIQYARCTGLMHIGDFFWISTRFHYFFILQIVLHFAYCILYSIFWPNLYILLVWWGFSMKVFFFPQCILVHASTTLPAGGLSPLGYVLNTLKNSLLQLTTFTIYTERTSTWNMENYPLENMPSIFLESFRNQHHKD